MKVCIVITILLLCSLDLIRTSEQDEFCPLAQDDCQKDLKGTLDDQNCFRAAVLEYARQDATDPHESVKTNLREFKLAARKAAEHGAQILIYPEDGLVYGNEEYLIRTIEEVPDPEALDQHDRNPCFSSDYTIKTHPMFKELSCIAAENSMYLVANFGTKEICKPNEPIGDRVCPESGYLKLNTNVVFDSQGNFIKRYRKYNLYIEVFDKPPTLELVYFDTPMGRFGTYTCFDMIFRHPAVDLVEKHGVDTIIFPTLWYDELPLLSAVQYQDAWSNKMNVNLLAANILNRELGTVGSGIYSGDDFLYSGANTTRTTLLIADIPKHPSKHKKCMQASEKLKLESGADYSGIVYQHGNYKISEGDNVQLINDIEATKTVCSGRLCCTIDYKINTEAFEPNSQVFIVRDSLRQGRFKWYEQVCSFASLQQPISDITNIGNIRFKQEGTVQFDRLTIKGIFKSEYVYPIAAFSNNELIPRTDRDYECNKVAASSREQSKGGRYLCKLAFKGKATDGKIYSFGLYGRVYENDIFE